MQRNRENVEHVYPLLPLQQGIYFHALGAEADDPYRTSVCFALRGELDLPALERAFREVVARHSALRAEIHAPAGKEPLLLVYREVPVRIARHTDEPLKLSAELRARLRLDRAAEPLLALTTCPDRHNYLIWAYHHALLDGWSVSNVLAEVATLYRAHSRGGAAELAAAPSYGQHLGVLGARSSDEARAYFEAHLAGFAEPTDFPARWMSEAAPQHRYLERRVALDRASSSRLREALKRWRITLNTYVQGLWALTAGAYSGSHDVVFGVTSSGRLPELAGAEHMVGMLIQTAPLRVRWQPDVTLLELMTQLQRSASLHPQHEHIGLSAIRERSELGAEQPLFESLVVFENYPLEGALEDAEPDALDATLKEHGEQLASGAIANRPRNNYPLCLVVQPGEEIELILAYHGERVRDDVAQDMLALLRALVEHAHQDDKRSVSALLRGQATPPQVRERRHAPLLPSVIAEWALRQPDDIAVRARGRSLRYGELARRSDAVAHALRLRGVRRDDRVALLLPRSVEFVIALLGSWKAGAAYVPVDPAQPRARWELLQAQSQSVLCIDGEELASLERQGADVPGALPPAHPQQAAYLIFTSGTTGTPKAVVVEHAALAQYTQALLQRLALPNGLSMALVSTLAADLGHTVLFGALASGGTLSLIAEEEVLDPERFAQQMARVDVLKIVPSLLAGLLQTGAEVLPRHSLVLGGEAASPELLARLRGRRVFNHYGPTETTVGVLMHALEPDERVLPLGTPFAHVRAKILDARLMPVPRGAPGELYLGGASVARGYFGNPSQTADRFLPDSDGGTMYRTGDRARQRADGQFEFLGRADGQVKLRGYRIELDEVRAAIVTQPGVLDAAVVLQATKAGAQLIGYVVGSPAEDLRAALEARLPEVMVPRHLIALERLPVTKNGKLDRAALPSPNLSSVVAQAATDPRTEALCAVFREVLKRELSADDSFFQQGGDSILALSVVSRAKRAGLKITPKQLLQHPSARALAGVATELVVTTKTAPSGNGVFPLSPIQRWFFTLEHGGRPQHWNQSVLLTVGEPLDLVALERAVERVVAHHEALRLTFPSAHEQRVDAAKSGLVEHVQLAPGRPFSAELEDALNRAQRSLRMQGPLFRAIYLSCGQERRLLLAAHHLVVDGVSWRILLEDLQAVYDAFVSGRSLTLPEPTASYRDWVELMHTQAASASVRAEAAYWHAQLDAPTQPARQYPLAGTRSLGGSLGAEETRALLERAPRRFDAEISDLLLAALAHALRAARGLTTASIMLEGHARDALSEQIDVSRTVGWFTSVFPLRLTAREQLKDSIASVRDARRALPHRGVHYGVLRQLSPDALPPAAEPVLLFNYLGQFDQAFPDRARFDASHESAGDSRSASSTRDVALLVNALVFDGQLSVDVDYSLERDSAESAQRLLDVYLDVLREIVSEI
jgi:amino acid adenylation domain-containing protein/non-ribosomal peptide synthase protein (TIGR01720 family)